MGIDKTRKQEKRALRRVLTRLASAAVIGAAIAGCFVGYNYLTTTDHLAVTEIEFNGLDRLDAGDLDRFVADIEGQNILVLPLESYAARFDSHPRIRRADFHRVIPNRVVCSVEEREPVALVFSGGFFEVDRDGMVMTPDELTELLDLPIVTGLEPDRVREGKRCADGQLGAALEILVFCQRFGGPFADDISELRITDGGINIVSLKEGVVLLLGETDYETRLKKYFLMKKTIAKKDGSSKLVDLRFDDQIVLRSGI